MNEIGYLLGYLRASETDHLASCVIDRLIRNQPHFVWNVGWDHRNLKDVERIPVQISASHLSTTLPPALVVRILHIKFDYGISRNEVSLEIGVGKNVISEVDIVLPPDNGQKMNFAYPRVIRETQPPDEGITLPECLEFLERLTFDPHLSSERVPKNGRVLIEPVIHGLGPGRQSPHFFEKLVEPIHDHVRRIEIVDVLILCAFIRQPAKRMFRPLNDVFNLFKGETEQDVVLHIPVVGLDLLMLWPTFPSPHGILQRPLPIGAVRINKGFKPTPVGRCLSFAMEILPVSCRKDPHEIKGAWKAFF